MSFVYVAPLKDSSAFKIGKAENPISRLDQLSRFYQFDWNNIQVVNFSDTRSSLQVEGSLHTFCDSYRMVFDYDGGTEFYQYSIYSSLMKVLEAVAELKSCKVEKLDVREEIIEDGEALKPDSVSQILSAISVKIKNKRIFQRITQQQLAEKAGVSEKSIRNLENGFGSSLSTLLPVLIALKMDDLVYGFTVDAEDHKRVRFKKVV